MEDTSIRALWGTAMKVLEAQETPPIPKQSGVTSLQSQDGTLVKNSVIPELRHTKMVDFPEPRWKEVYARRKAAIRRTEQLIGKTFEHIADNEDDMSVAEPRLEGKQRKQLESRVEAWLGSVPESSFEEGQRRLSAEEKQEWLKMARKLKSVAVNEEIKRAGSWVGARFFPEGFW